MPFLKDRSKAAPSRVGSDPFIDSGASPTKSIKTVTSRGGSPTSPRVLKNASPTSKQQPTNGIGRSPPTPTSPSDSTSPSSSRNSISPTRRKGVGSIGASRQPALPPLHLNLSNIKKIVAWPGQPVNPPTPLAHPPTPLARPPVPGTPSVASANGASASFPFGSSPSYANAAASSSKGGKQGAVNPSVAALRMSRNEETRDMLSPFALPSHQPQQYIAYNLDASTPKSPVAPLSPPATPHSSKTTLNSAQTSPQRITAPLPKGSRAYKVPAIPPFKQQQPQLAEAKQVIKESKTAPPSITATNKFIKEKGLAPAFVEQYDILNELGSGGFGFVVKARRKRDGFIVAVKFIFRERIPSHNWVKTRSWSKLPNGEPDNTDRLVPMEAYVLRMIRHRGVVAFLDLLEDANVFYLVMEHHGTPWMASNENDENTDIKMPPSPASTEGGLPELALHNTPSGYFSSSSTLSSSPSSSTGPPTPVSPNMPLSTPAKLAPPPMLRRSSCDLFECIEQHSRLSEDQARYVFAQIVDVVYHLATMGICHRDIKDENIVVDQDFRVKLIDFGSAVIFDVRKPVPYHSRFFGTVNFAASEILQGRPYRAPHAEVWSLGVLLSILLTGETPFPDPEHAVKGIINKPRSSMSAEALDLMLGCLEVDPDHRLDITSVKMHPWLLYPRSS